MQMMLKLNQNGSRNRYQILKNPEKRHPKIDAKIWCRKVVPPEPGESTSVTPGLHFWTGRGGRGGKISDYTGYFGRLLILSTRSPPRRGAADEQWSKMGPGGTQDRFILRFHRFWEKAKKLYFSMRFRGDQKTRKIDPWSAKGSKKSPWETTNIRTGRQGGHGTRV